MTLAAIFVGSPYFFTLVENIFKKWNLICLGPPVSGGGKRKKASEASRLLDDEGVIHMLNRLVT